MQVSDVNRGGSIFLIFEHDENNMFCVKIINK